MGMIKGRDEKIVLRKKEGWPEDYHDYVFRDGKLIGDFDNMYRYAREVPWNQDTGCHHWDAEVGILMLKEHSPYGSILEIGCGLEYFAAQLKGLEGSRIDAFDVSQEAIRKARKLHPGIYFYVDVISQKSYRPKKQYDLIVIRDVFWYVFKQMETVVRNINESVKAQGFLYICQYFPALNGSFVGKDVIPTPDALLRYFPNYDPLYTALLRNHRIVKDGPILHFLGIKAR